MSDLTYCTILATNYLPKALSLAESLAEHHPDAELVVLLIDCANDSELPDISHADLPGVRLVSTAFLGLPQAQVDHLAMIYDLVEFATAIKPLAFKRVLETAEQVAYLDPDTYVTAPMEELSKELDASDGGILLTPHFLEPLPEGGPVAQGHLLTVGVYNLGFGAWDRRALEFLDWWWARLKEECLFDYLSGLFVDQKWMDIGSVLYQARSLRHYGYNVSVVNLHERPIGADSSGLVMLTTGEPLRLFHFHAFDPDNPTELSTRQTGSTSELRSSSEAVDALCREYADRVLRHRSALGDAPAYPYWTDSSGRRISRQLRRAYRLSSAGLEDSALPSAFAASDAEAFAAWRRRSWKKKSRELLGDAAKSARLALPEEYGRLRSRFPKLASSMKGKLVGKSGIWG
ncbi:hypothetical protein [Nocardioides sp. Root151]|uniref:hypothetical protein n=1 Tax=Nocardioides sp. Root151 TaxID=1736475 RepID=UPI0007027F35|nr:hypothetical protein [Nocardioides sp. Root151]KQZ66859.1 hypothetical protein ASD66_17710 [Nocardioides sp. Root151]